MKNLFNNIGPFILFLGFAFLLSLGLFSIEATNIQQDFQKRDLLIEQLCSKVDSLESVVNTSFRNKRDTIVIDIKPQVLKYYHYEK